MGMECGILKAIIGSTVGLVQEFVKRNVVRKVGEGQSVRV